ncbi:MAG: Hsp20/alpha crystallin family protein [Candidatus Aenigmarchaeota archaeon]|nr:Hsp20/alpha crystallin family protein [Candidatus Aenigmarchaeota archaeon]
MKRGKDEKDFTYYWEEQEEPDLMEADGLEINEVRNGVTIEVMLPGFRKRDIDVRISGGNSISIDASRKDGAYSFSQSFSVPLDLDNASVTASYSSGILSITISRKKRGRKIKIN